MTVYSKRRKVDKGGKGLRHFSMKVCEKVQKKGTTTYNEVADELVAEFTDPVRCTSPADQVLFLFEFINFTLQIVLINMLSFAVRSEKYSASCLRCS